MWRPVGLSGVAAAATSSTSKHPLINDKWACTRSLFPTVAVCGARRCLAPPPRIRGTAATFFRPWARGRQPANLLGSFWLLRSRWRLGAPVVFQDRVQQGGAVSEETRTCTLCAPRTNTHEGYSAPCPCAPDAWRRSWTWSTALRRYASGRQNCNRGTSQYSKPQGASTTTD